MLSGRIGKFDCANDVQRRIPHRVGHGNPHINLRCQVKNDFRTATLEQLVPVHLQHIGGYELKVVVKRCLLEIFQLSVGEIVQRRDRVPFSQ